MKINDKALRDVPGTGSAQGVLAISDMILFHSQPVQGEAAGTISPPACRAAWARDDQHRTRKWPETDKRVVELNMREVTTQS